MCFWLSFCLWFASSTADCTNSKQLEAYSLKKDKLAQKDSRKFPNSLAWENALAGLTDFSSKPIPSKKIKFCRLSNYIRTMCVDPDTLEFDLFECMNLLADFDLVDTSKIDFEEVEIEVV